MMKPSLQLKLGQSLTMTPQLQQAIRLLQLPVLDLNAQILEAIEENIMLEIDELPDVAATETDTAVDADNAAEIEIEQIGIEDDWQSASMERDWSDSGSPFAEYADQSGDSLKDHLLWQLELENFTPREAMIGEALIDATDDAGYLTLGLEEIREGLARDAEISIEEIESALRKVQRMDPAGVAARTPAECISLQLRQLSPDTEGLTAAIDIAEQSLDLVADQDYTALRHRHRLTVEDLDTALALVRGCNPKPGLSVSPSATEYVVPDVYVRKVDDRWQVEISGTGIPRLSVNQQYARLLRGDGDHSVLKSQLQEARWLVRSLEIRNETLLKVASNIVGRQTEFLEHGEEHMRPLVLRDIADAVGMHESTISRVTTNKYMHTPRGIFEFKYFFSSHLSSADGEDQSSIAVRAKIRKLIGAENPAKPLSDNKVAKLLSEEGINVARRTVAKYREAMNIASSSERKARENR